MSTSFVMTKTFRGKKIFFQGEGLYIKKEIVKDAQSFETVWCRAYHLSEVEKYVADGHQPVYLREWNVAIGLEQKEG